MPVAVWGPVRGHTAREPDRAVLGHRTPAAIFIEVLISDGIIRYVLRCFRMFPALIAAVTPAIEIVAFGNAFDIGIQLVRAGKVRGLTGANRISGPASGHFALSIANSDQRGVAIFVDINAIGPRPKNVERQVWRIDFQSLVFIEPPDTNVQRAFSQPDLPPVTSPCPSRTVTSVASPFSLTSTR